MKIKSALTEIGKHVAKDIRCLNWGGCGVFAHIVGAHISEFLPTEIVVDSYSCVDLGLVREKLSAKDRKDPYKWNDHNVNFCHILLVVKYKGRTYMFDSDGIQLKARHTICKGSLTVKETKDLVAKQAGWNDSFNRRQIPQLKKQADEFFKTHRPIFEKLKQDHLEYTK